ncbi:MAG: rubrerythrin family protein [Methanomassiliicoccus sp.]|nr:rubrerythrin family protein [Methanomassiliicoccus sp.]
MSDTVKNLKEAFAGESQANRKYLAFAQKAHQDGYEQVARLFRAAAEAETIHAHAHLRVLKGVKTTEENLQEAINGENYEHTTMYPGFIEQAKKEGNKDAVRSFTFANEVEKVHEALYKAAYSSVQSKKDLPTKKLYICPVCGNIEEGEPPEECSVCGAPGSSFREVL